MGWADHEPPGGWNAPTPKQVPGGIEVGHMFFPWENFDVVPAAKLRAVEAERDDLRGKAKKAQREAAEDARLDRLATLKRKIAEAPQWKRVRGEQWPKW